ncbi:MAG: aminotransferase class III-fold pyridoxal phosphate-dependent enzyme [Proteobacteria bacterium]|nr:aminotransferase class III-fold pyridoxal phosphate-dependent enzyme [Pseudomonadota bacterium]
MTIAKIDPDAAAAASRSQDEYFAIAEKNLPGGGLGGYALPDELRYIIRRGEGSRIQAADGRWYIDYIGGAGANILGHSHPAVVQAITERAAEGLHFFAILNDAALELSEKLVAHIPCAEKIVFTTTGSEATFFAMRIARAATGREKVLKFEGAYHGTHDYAAISLFPKAAANYPVGSVDTAGMPEAVKGTVLVAPYNDLDAVERIVAEAKDELAAIIVEPVQRIIFPEPGFLAGLREICDRYGIVLIFDEVVTGFRLGLGGGQGRFGVTPDLASFGKIVGGGGPLGCVAGKAELLDHCDPRRKGEPGYAFINGTLHGNPLASVAGLATIAVLEEEGFYDALFAKSERLTSLLQEVLDRRGVPAICAGRDSFWQILFTPREPRNQIDILAGDSARMRKLDLELIRRGISILPGTRRFTAAVNTEEDFALTAEALDGACKALG